MHRTDHQDSFFGLPGLRNTRFTTWTGLALLLIGAVRGFHSPNAYAYTLSLIDYSVGFVKRGLFGTIFGAVSRQTYHDFALASIFLLALSLGSLGWVVWKLAAAPHFHTRTSALVFASSFAVVFLAHINGYLDHAGILLTVAVLSIADWRRQAAAALVAFCLGVALHEATFVLFFPVVIGVLLVKVRLARTPAGTLAVLALGAVVAAWAMAASGHSLDPARIERLSASIARTADVPLHEGALEEVLRSERGANLAYMARFWRRSENWFYLFLSLVVTLPPLLYMLAEVRRRLQAAAIERWAAVLMILAPLSPLALHLVGWDTHRWNMMAIVTTLLAIYGLDRAGLAVPQTPAVRPDRLALIFLVVILLNGVGAVPLFGDVAPVPFPFCEHIRTLAHSLKGN